MAESGFSWPWQPWSFVSDHPFMTLIACCVSRNDKIPLHVEMWDVHSSTLVNRRRGIPWRVIIIKMAITALMFPVPGPDSTYHSTIARGFTPLEIVSWFEPIWTGATHSLLRYFPAMPTASGQHDAGDGWCNVVVGFQPARQMMM